MADTHAPGQQWAGAGRILPRFARSDAAAQPKAVRRTDGGGSRSRSNTPLRGVGTHWVDFVHPRKWAGRRPVSLALLDGQAAPVGDR